MKKRLLLSLPLGLCLTHPSLAEPVFLPGVTEESGWYDCNKRSKWNSKAWPTRLGNPQINPNFGRVTPTNDTALCWAMAASNVLQWWQDSWGDSLPANIPNGLRKDGFAIPDQQIAHLDIYHTIGSNWSGVGSRVYQAYNYWFNGGQLSTVPGSSLTGSNQGGYWQQLGFSVPDTYDALGSNPLFSIHTFTQESQADVYSALTVSINNQFGTTLTVGEKGVGHAIAMWGYDYDADGTLIIYVTDSDDSRAALAKRKVIVHENMPEEYVLDTSGNLVPTGTLSTHIYLVSLDEEPYLEQYQYADGITGTRLGEIQSLTVPLGHTFLAVPEPASSSLTLLAMGVFLSRRRRTP